ncbi:MAG TPA: hypothetical protein VFY74_06525, partial [Methyloceanibacter sp.]|nr:hypothetical protein [Methyloceanibacter sp.]
MHLRVSASAVLIALVSVLAPAAAQDRGESGSGIRLAQAEGPMVITPQPYSGQPGSYPPPQQYSDQPGSYPPPQPYSGQPGSYPPPQPYSGQPGSYPPPPNGYDAGGPGAPYEPAPQGGAYVPRSGGYSSQAAGD